MTMWTSIAGNSLVYQSGLQSPWFLVNKSLLVIQNEVIHSFFTHIPQRCNIQNLHHHWNRPELCTVPGQYLCYGLSKVTKRIYTTTYACPAVSWNSKGSKNPTSQTHIRSKNPIRHWELFATVTKLLDSYLHRLLPQMNFRKNSLMSKRPHDLRFTWQKHYHQCVSNLHTVVQNLLHLRKLPGSWTC